MKTPACLLTLLLAIPLSFALAAEQPTAARPTAAAAPAVAQKSLYERLGGVYPIAVVVDDFIERLLVDDALNANPAIHRARERVPKQGLKFQVTALGLSGDRRAVQVRWARHESRPRAPEYLREGMAGDAGRLP